MGHYTLVYTVPAVNVSPATLAAALDKTSIPSDANMESELGLSVTSDTTTSAGATVTRTIVYASAPGPLGDPYTRDALQNYYTETFSRLLSTRVEAAPVVFA